MEDKWPFLPLLPLFSWSGWGCHGVSWSLDAGWRGSRAICSLCWSCSLACSWVCLCSVTLLIGVLLDLLSNTAYERKASEGRERQVVAGRCPRGGPKASGSV